MPTKTKSVLLPNNVSPISYKLRIHPDLLSFTFSGNEIIKIKINKETNKITLHSKDIDIETVKYINKKKEEYASKITYNLEKETATFHFKNKIKKGTGELSIIFSGIITDNLRGFYKSKYQIDGKEKYLVTTQFESTDARRAFPCFDEPAHKASFEVSFIIPNDHTAISNTLPITIKEHNEGYKIVSFSPTPKMSTYLLAFIIGEFEYVEGKTHLNKSSGQAKEGVQIRVFTTKGKMHQAKFALDVAIKSLEFYNEYFDIPYPMPNLDLIAIPDFESGAMENWGAITFRETALLVDEENSSLSNKQWVALVIAHEIAHQWFGNLVTMHWWTDLWLNEGFASYMEKACINKLFPNWNIWEMQISSGRFRKAIGIDSLENSHPIEVKVEHPDEISEIFDMVSYEKGSAIIRMLNEYLGENKFRNGLKYYLKKHSYANTKTIHLWEAFEKISGKPVKKIMNTWTNQSGFPLVNIRSISKNYLELSQERYFSSRISKKNNKDKSLWQIPISYNNKKIILNKKKIIIKNEIENKINQKETSFIRVRYNSEILENIKKEITENHVSIIDRLGIIRDVFSLAEGGYIKTSEALELSLIFKDEKEYIILSELASKINKIFYLIKDESFIEKYKEYCRSLFTPLVEYMGFEKKKGEKHEEIFLRNLAISQSAFYGDKKVIKEIQKIFTNRVVKQIDADIRGLIYNTVAANGKISDWKLFEKLFEKETMHEEKDRYAVALTSFKNIDLLKKSLSFIMSSKIREQDTPHLLSAIWMNEKGQDLVFEFIMKNWGIILKKYGEGGHFLSKLVEPLGEHKSLKDLKDAKKFFSKNVAPGAERTLKQAYEKIASNVAWLHDDKKDIENWLNKNY